MKNCILFLWCLSQFLLVKGQYAYTTAGAVYFQNFDGLPNSGVASAFPLTGAGPFNLSASPISGTNLTGWQFYKIGGSGSNAVFSTGTGSNNNGDIYSFGSSGSTNRALGSLPTSGATYAIGFLITNNTGTTLNAFTVSFTAEQWRNGGSNISNIWTFKYKIGSSFSTINQASLSTNANLNFSSVISSASIAVLDGTVSANQSLRSYTITGITWNNGDQLLLRWDDAAHSNSDAMAIDNFSFAGYTSTSNIYTWSGGASGSYTTAANWTPNRISPSINDILVFNASGSVSVDNVASETINDIIVSNTAAVNLHNSAAASILTVSDHLNIGAGASLSLGTNSNVKIASTAAANVNGTLNTNNAVTLQSDNIGSASIDISAGIISGNVIVERYIPAQRAYRLLSHPFSNNIPLSSLLSSIDITGPAGNGFTNAAGTNPSAYSYITTSDSWQPFSNASNTWNAGQGLLVFIRGKTNEGLSGSNAAADNYNSGGPSNVTLSLVGAINTGNLTYTTGSGNTWNLVGNPYSSSIDITQINNLITTAGGSNAYIYLWDPNAQQTFKAVKSGAYIAKQLSSSIILPSGSAFFVKNTTGVSKTLTFTENCKANNSSALALFGMNDQQTRITLRVTKDNIPWDEVSLQFNENNSSAANDAGDLDKFSNSNLDLYSISSDQKFLAVDVRSIHSNKNDTILLGIQSMVKSSFLMEGNVVKFPSHSTAYLHDKFLNRHVKIDNDLKYAFEINQDPSSQGNNRFELILQKETIQFKDKDAFVKNIMIIPNPVRDVIEIRFSKPLNAPANIRFINSVGQVVKSIQEQTEQNALIIPVNDLVKGIYFIEINDALSKYVQKIIKE